jgi:hypothetical protein
VARQRKIDKARDENEAAAQAVASLVGAPREYRKQKGPTAAKVEKMIAEMNEMRTSNDWSEARPAHLVALYAWAHAQVYGVPASELVGLNWLAAASASAKLVRDEFGDDPSVAVEFMRWTWKREKSREQWRRDNGKDGGRLTWRAQFQQRYVLTDYRIDQARKARRGG